MNLMLHRGGGIEDRIRARSPSIPGSVVSSLAGNVMGVWESCRQPFKPGVSHHRLHMANMRVNMEQNLPPPQQENTSNN